MKYIREKWFIPASCLVKEYRGKEVIIDKSMFTPFNTACIYGHSKCGNACCRVGSWVFHDNHNRIAKKLNDIIPYMEHPQYVSDGIFATEHYQPIRYTNTTVAEKSNAYLIKLDAEHKCIFLTRKGKDGREGCAIHKYALDNEIDPIYIKPWVCSIYPMQFRMIQGTNCFKLQRAAGIAGNSLPCLEEKKQDGPLMIESKYNDIKMLFQWSEEKTKDFINYFAHLYGINTLQYWQTSNSNLSHINNLGNKGQVFVHFTPKTS